MRNIPGGNISSGNKQKQTSKSVFAVVFCALLIIGCAGPFQILRQERMPDDAPYSYGDLKRNFMTLALNSEFANSLTGPIRKTTETPIAKWVSPVRMSMAGASEKEHKHLHKLARRLSNATGLNIHMIQDHKQANFVINFMDYSGRARVYRKLLAQNAPRKSLWVAQNWGHPGGAKCFARLFRRSADSALHRVEVYIKSELSQIHREACLTEEITQGFGIMNDDPNVRPSIFNDDEEFMELTDHDESLIRMLYDRRIRPGMQAHQVAPLLDNVLADINRPRATLASFSVQDSSNIARTVQKTPTSTSLLPKKRIIYAAPTAAPLPYVRRKPALKNILLGTDLNSDTIPPKAKTKLPTLAAPLPQQETAALTKPISFHTAAYQDLVAHEKLANGTLTRPFNLLAK